MNQPSVRRVVQLLTRLPGVGERTATRYVLHWLTDGGNTPLELAEALTALAQSVVPCEDCGNLAERAPGGASLCALCMDSRRDGSVICVVARVQDVSSLERAGTMRGRYFVLGRLLSPLEGIGPDALPLARLQAFAAKHGAKELILATPPSVDGEATALWLKREFEREGLSITRIASGVPHGGDLEYADPITLGRALQGRRTL